MEAKRRIKKFNFEADGAHVALVAKGANDQEVLLYKSVDDVTNKEKEEKTMVDEEIQKAVDAALAAKQVEIEKALAAKDAEIQKSRDAIAELEKAVETKDKEKLAEVIKGYSYIEDSDKFVDCLFTLRKSDSFSSILDVLEKAQKAIDAATTQTKGADGDVEVIEKGFEGQMSKVTEILKNRKKGDK